MGNVIEESRMARSILVLGLTLCFVGSSLAEENKRQIEEVIVTAEKVESTVSDTSISITAFSEEAIEDFGIQEPMSWSTIFLQQLEMLTIFELGGRSKLPSLGR